MKEIVVCETTFLLEQQHCLFIRDLANKFEKGLAIDAKLSKKAIIKEVASLGKHVYLKNLKMSLSLKGNVAGRNKDDVKEAIAMVDALAVQLIQREV
ncbi:hypothetical protein GOBAR_AA35968 [Gossypium barbadense]|uniref:Uncharacterized protein n=1 Tax=Gossypium barbadense TaxID=3634 RepID=A0A2P5W0Z0_GOSBA|nr:hypothetical protein GOBAR_AA35968 [Gossypium barbadense]